ncbi:MAG: hypothetical protein CMK09_09070 [Ponticaulis sp.]|nr:hypothetical protein [Ponticaulis sp.]|tara:strand:- start:41377 stop:42939 length:1563 start_codon:yes stop_codon:yes gene_type:complete
MGGHEVKSVFSALALIAAASLVGCSGEAPSQETAAPAEAPAKTQTALDVFPAMGATGVNPDTHLFLDFETLPEIGSSGLIEIRDVDSGKTVDQIDLSIPFSPNPTGRQSVSTEAERRALAEGFQHSDYQFITISGVDFLYHPVLVQNDRVQIDLHPGVLGYGRTYQVIMSPDTLIGGDFGGITADDGWTFTTKTEAPSADTDRVVVAADGSGDFNTLQGALDFAPDASPDTPFEIFIRNGVYEELIFLTEKSDIVVRGESRDGVVVGYPNNSAFNPPQPAPSRRPAFTLYNVEDVQLSDFTIENQFIGQAEALLIRGKRVVVDNMQLNGSGDALTTYGSIYMQDTELTGDGDTILAYASLYCLRCTIKSKGPFTWTRTPDGQHGNVFIASRFVRVNEPLPWTVTAENPEGRIVDANLARLPRNGPGSSAPNFPHAEMVIIDSTLVGISEEGWGPVEPPETFDWSGVNFMEFNSVDADGNPIDQSGRHPIVKILDADADAEVIANYRSPAYVLDGWTPDVR